MAHDLYVKTLMTYNDESKTKLSGLHVGRGRAHRANPETQVCFSALVLFISFCCAAQSNVYSLAVYSGGNYYRQLCSFAFPFPPFGYKLTERSWYEDSNGHIIIGIGHEKISGGVLKRLLEIEYGAESFSVPLDSVPPKKAVSNPTSPGIKGSGDLAQLVIQRMNNRGGRATTNTLSVFQANWVRYSRDILDIIVLEGDHFIEVARFLEQAYGAPDNTFRSAASVGNARSLVYAHQQIGILLVLAASPGQTIVSVIGEKKP